jgi:2,3-bisphosphoglycerate-dependent phosphoglycerate mutase
VATTIVFETHALSEDNERGVASGWAHSRLSERGQRLAEELGERRRTDGIATVFSSDLHRAVETTAIAFPSGYPPVLLDWRLRECDYGDCNAGPADAHYQGSFCRSRGDRDRSAVPEAIGAGPRPL